MKVQYARKEGNVTSFSKGTIGKHELEAVLHALQDFLVAVRQGSDASRVQRQDVR
jgi:hypothetical protein